MIKKITNALPILCRQWLAPLALGCALCQASNAGPSQADNRPTLAIVIDDIGYHRSSAQKLIALPYELTFSVLPISPYGKELAELAWIRGKEVMLHIPMATQTNAKLDPGGIALNMPPTHITELIATHIASYPQASGINNHMGSRLTELEPAMGAVMQALTAQDLFFIDSRTSAQSVAYDQAKKAGLQTAKRDIFLDNEQSIVAIAMQLEKAVALAEKNGNAVAIGHPYPETYAALKRQLPLLTTRVKVVPSSTLLRNLSHNQREPAHTTSQTNLSNRPWLQGLSK
ncbi:divergent polysaccharide deacetylase family protein [Simiduia curdlanivorans]|uniref:Divergent polysaccharide deacetylase family protein n=1 Tax=Simiduia curdlanivorans TaxID=1492769 RepID=A0ABV8V795_9GAMM|nr:divergent polysaccharide deacetylase family protein [Simiduia curdlanivorans]MDN3637416.1 divergent polysaccharide deacetylase family protein [Simiduia curdlanivorans]